MVSPGEPRLIRPDQPMTLAARAAQIVSTIFRTGSRVVDLSSPLPKHFVTAIEGSSSEWLQLARLADLSSGKTIAVVQQFSLTASPEPPILYARDGSEDDAVRGKAGIILQIVSATTTAGLPADVLAAISVRAGLITPGQASGDIVIDYRTGGKVIQFVQRKQFLGLWAEIAFNRSALQEIRSKERSRVITRLRHTDRPTITGVYLA